jgi:hypothetical protein
MHWFTGDWRIDDNHYYIDDRSIFNYVKINKIPPQLLSIDDIAFKKPVDVNFYRFKRANISYPIIVSEMVNPESKKYRLIDGRHRIHKILFSGETRALSYVLPAQFIYNNLIQVEEQYVAKSINI